MSASRLPEISIAGRTVTLTLPRSAPGVPHAPLSRRDVLRIGARLGLAAPAVVALSGASGASAAPQVTTLRTTALRQDAPQRFTFVRDDSIPDLARIIHERDNGASIRYSDSVESPESWRCPAWTSLPQRS